MKFTRDDIRRQASCINIAIATAVAAALVSYAEGQVHGSHANNNILNAVHWLLVVVLVGGRVLPNKFKNTIELVWFIYGLLFGELEVEDAACSALITISAATFFIHRRVTVPRAEASANTIASATDERDFAAEM